MPPGLDDPALYVLLATSFAASLMTAALGIGGGVLLLATMASLVPPAALIPVHGVIQLGSNAGRAALLFRALHRPAVPGFLGGTLAGCAAGGLVAVDLPASAVQIGVGLFVLWSVFRSPPEWLRRSPWVSGLASSLLTMFFGATGPFVASYVKAFALPRHAHVATHAALMTLQHAAKIAVFGLLGFAFAPWAGFALAMIVAGFAGTLAGRRVLDRMSDRGFRRALDALLVLIALRLVWSGAQAL